MLPAGGHKGPKAPPPRHFLLYRRSKERVIDVERVCHDAQDLVRHLPGEYGAVRTCLDKRLPAAGTSPPLPSRVSQRYELPFAAERQMVGAGSRDEDSGRSIDPGRSGSAPISRRACLIGPYSDRRRFALIPSGASSGCFNVTRCRTHVSAWLRNFG